MFSSVQLIKYYKTIQIFHPHLKSFQRIFKRNMDTKTLNECFDHVHKLALECGEIIKTAAKETKKVETKSHRMDFVTEYDKKVEEILINGILEKYPNHK